MARMSRVAVLQNEVEGDLLGVLLEERGIPHIIRSYHDAALDGLFQVQKGWGCVEAEPDYAPAITQVLTDLRDQAEARADEEPESCQSSDDPSV